jgi:hypothetical protein
MAKVRTVISSADYKIDEKLTNPNRTAHFLAWYQAKAPDRLIAAADLYKIVYNVARRPGDDSREVKLFRNSFPRVRRILLQKYSLGLHIKPGVGVRATFSTEDFADTSIRATVKRSVSNTKQLAEQLVVTDISKIKSKSLKTMVLIAKSIVKAVDLPTNESKLLPAKADETT